MINLIPPAAKKRVIAEYWVRTFSLWSFLGGTAWLLIATLFIPLNIYVLNQESYLAALVANNETEETNQKQNTDLLVRANQQAALLLQSKREYTLHELLPLLRTFSGETTLIEEVTLKQDKTPVVTIAGLAQSRQSLMQFRDDLEKHSDFLTVDLPISNLIKERDVSFSLTITLATSTPNL